MPASFLHQLLQANRFCKVSLGQVVALVCPLKSQLIKSSQWLCPPEGPGPEVVALIQHQRGHFLAPRLCPWTSTLPFFLTHPLNRLHSRGLTLARNDFELVASYSSAYLVLWLPGRPDC